MLLSTSNDQKLWRPMIIYAQKRRHLERERRRDKYQHRRDCQLKQECIIKKKYCMKSVFLFFFYDGKNECKYGGTFAKPEAANDCFRRSWNGHKTLLNEASFLFNIYFYLFALPFESDISQLFVFSTYLAACCLRESLIRLSYTETKHTIFPFIAPSSKLTQPH